MFDAPGVPPDDPHAAGARRALGAAGLDMGAEPVARAVGWLMAIRNPDGGWGEDGDNYRLDYDGHRPFPSTPSRTAWAGRGAAAHATGVGARRDIDRFADSVRRSTAGTSAGGTNPAGGNDMIQTCLIGNTNTRPMPIRNGGRVWPALC